MLISLAKVAVSCQELLGYNYDRECLISQCFHIRGIFLGSQPAWECTRSRHQNKDDMSPNASL